MFLQGLWIHSVIIPVSYLYLSFLGWTKQELESQNSWLAVSVMEIPTDESPQTTGAEATTSDKNNYVAMTKEHWEQMLGQMAQLKESSKNSELIIELLKGQNQLMLQQQKGLSGSSVGAGQLGQLATGTSLGGGAAACPQQSMDAAAHQDDDNISLAASDGLVEEDKENDLNAVVNQDLDISGDEEDTEEQEDEVSGYLNDLVEEELGEPIGDAIAKALGRAWNEEIKLDKLKEVLKDIKTPQNCAFAIAPKLNPEIYAGINQDAQAKDKKSQRHQKLMVKTAIPIMSQLGILNSTKISGKRKEDGKRLYTITEDEMKQLRKHATNSFSAISQLNKDWIISRREYILYKMGRRYRSYRFPREVKGEYLFTEDICKKIVKEMKRSSSSSTTTSQKSSYMGYRSQKNSSGKNKHVVKSAGFTPKNARSSQKSRGRAGHPDNH